MTKFVLNRYELNAKKSEAQAKIVSAFDYSISILGGTIEVKCSSDATKVADILNQLEVQYTGG